MPNLYKFKTKPFKHQVEALRKLLGDPAKDVGGNLFMDMGTGKTKVAIDYAGILEQVGLIKQVLVLCPLDALGVWNLEMLKHSGTETLKWRVINYDRTFRYSITKRDELGDIKDISEIDNFTPLADFVNEAPTLLVLDEADEIGKPTTKRARHIYVLSQLCERTLNMTGTPIRKYPLDLFDYCRRLDEGILGGSWGVFKRTYGVWGGYGNNKLLYPINAQKLFTRVEPYTYACELKDVHDMPRQMPPEIIPVQMQESRELYERYATEAIVTFEGMDFEASIILTKLLRLRQLTGGWLVSNERRRRVGREKERAIESKLKQMYRADIEKVVIYANFLDDMRTIARVCQKVGYHVIPFWGGLKRDQRDRFVARFEEIRRPTVWLSQSRAGTRAIPLTAAHHTLYYSLTDRYTAFEQSMSRTWRIGQSHPCYYGVFSMESTVDEALWLSIRTKRSFAKLVYMDPELIR